MLMSKDKLQIQKELLARISELELEIKKLKDKKYGLIWEDKPEDVVLQCQENIPILREVKNRKIVSDNSAPNNLLIEGDNYHSLSVLNYTHAGKIDVIYADPPYNTGATDWKYNNDYVDSQDTFRHSKWISFMEKRLKLAKKLLSNNGIICVTIDDYELPTLWLLMDSIFGEDNHLGTVVIRNNPSGRKTKRKIAQVHEYALFFGNQDSFIKNLDVEFADKSHKYVQDTDGSWYSPGNLRKQGIDSQAEKGGVLADRFFPIYYDPKTGRVSSKDKLKVEILPIDPMGEKRIWRRGKDAIDEMYKNGDLWCQETRNGIQVYYKFRGGVDGEPPKSIWYESEFSASEHGTRMLNEILPKREMFQYPKSLYAIMQSIKIISTDPNSIVLDFFAGSGTTGHAVLELNKQDGGNRKFILCTNNENNICEEVTYERVKRIVKGYTSKKGEKIDGLGGNLSYYKTDLVNVDKLHKISDEAKIKVTYQAGEMIAVREDTLKELEKNDWWQIFEGKDKKTAIYFKEDKTKIKELISKLEKEKTPAVLYVFGWGKNEYKNEYSSSLIRVEDIPEPILEVYKEINRL